MIKLDILDLARIEDKLKNLNEHVANKIEEMHDARFDTLTDYLGLPYKPNSPAWIAIKGNNKPTTGITGNMRATIGVTSHSDLVELVSNAEYSSFVQKERPFIGLLDFELSSIVDSFFK